MKTWWDARNVTRKEIQLIFARGSQARHPEFWLCQSIPCNGRILLLPPRQSGRPRDDGGNGPADDGVGRAFRNPIYHEDVRQAVIEAVTLFQSNCYGVQATIAREANGTGILALVACLRSVDQGVTRGDDRFRQYDGLQRIFAVVARLIRDQAVCECKRKETPFCATIIQWGRTRGGGHQDRKWWNSVNVNKEREDARDVDIGLVESPFQHTCL